MKKIFLLLSLCCLMIMAGGCASFLRPGSHVDNTSVFQALPPYNGPKAKISLVDFSLTATKADSGVGNGLHTLLTTALVNSGRFSVSKHQVNTTGAQPQAADLIIGATVYEFEPQASGGRAGIGGGGSVSSGMLGGLLGTSPNKARVVLDLHIIDAATSKTIATTRLKGQASDSTGIKSANLLGNIVLGDGLLQYANTPMEKAIRVCIIEAVRYIAQNLPPEYYKY